MIVRSGMGGTVDWIWQGDPAVDQSAGAEERYQRYLDTGDTAHLQLSGDPVVWQVQVPRGLVKAAIQEALAESNARGGNGVEACVIAAALATVGVRNLKTQDGGDWKPSRATYHGKERLTDKCLQEIDSLGEGLLVSLGAFAIRKSTADPK